jgi:hypothetical protein
MATGTKHEHIDMHSGDVLAGLIEHRDPTLRRAYLDAHRLVTETLPDLAYAVDCHDGAIGYGARQHGYDNRGMAALAPFSRWVSLAFLRGAALEEPGGLLEGSGAGVRHVKLRSPGELAARREPLRRLLGAAARLNEEESP